MKKRDNIYYLFLIFVVTISVFLQSSQVFAEPGDEVTDENVGEYSTRHPEEFGTSDTITETESEEEKIARLKSEGEADNEVVNYYTIRYMSLTEEYPKELLNKKYQMMDSYIRWLSKLSWNEDYSSEKSLLIYKIGVINTIETLDSGDVVFTLNDNPEKRFLIYAQKDWAYQRFLTKPGDLVHLLTTVDRRVYHFDNWNLTRGQDISYDNFNPKHPEDVIVEGYFPSVLYKQRIEEYGIPNDSFKLLNEYTDPWLENYYGEKFITAFSINKNSIIPDEEWMRAWKAMNDSCSEFINENRAAEDWACRDDLSFMGIDVSSIKENIVFRTEYVKTFQILDDGSIEFTTWESPTREYFFSKEYGQDGLIDSFWKNQKVHMYYNEVTREVYSMKFE